MEPKSIQANKEKMKNQLEDIWSYAQHIAADEDKMPPPPDLSTKNPESVNAAIEKLNQVSANIQAIPGQKLQYLPFERCVP